MKLFHGTNIDFDNIDLKMSKPNKDFGQGFYLSDTRQQAEELAMARVELTGGNPVVIEYDFDEELLHDRSPYTNSSNESMMRSAPAFSSSSRVPLP